MAGWMGSGDGLLGSVIVGWELGAALAVVGDCVRARWGPVWRVKKACSPACRTHLKFAPLVIPKKYKNITFLVQ